MIRPAIPSGLYRPIETMMSTMMFSAASRVGIQGRWTREERARQQQVQPAERQAEREPEQRDRDQVRGGGVELPAFEDQPHDRRREHDHERRRGDQQQVDLAHADADRAAHAARVAPRRHAAERREQHGRDGDAEQALRAACRCGTRCRSRAAPR